RPLLLLHLAHQLPEHVAEAEHGVDLQAVGLAVERRQRVVSAENVGGAVDQEDVIAFHRGATRNGRGLRGAGCAGLGGHGADLTPRTDVRHRFGGAIHALLFAGGTSPPILTIASTSPSSPTPPLPTL